MSSSPVRRLPRNPDLQQQKTLSRELLEHFRSADPAAIARIRSALPDKQHITLADAQFALAREYGFVSWAALKQHIEAGAETRRSPVERITAAFDRNDAAAVGRLLERHPELRSRIDDPVFAFDSPAIVHWANDAAMVQVLIEHGADPNGRSTWWAGGFHALYSATGLAAERLIAAGATIDACAAAHLDRIDVLSRLLAEDPARVHERGGDGQTPLHFARSRAAVDLLLDAGADIDARDLDHRSSAAEWMLDGKRGAGRYDLAKYLVERGAPADIFLGAALGLTGHAHALLQGNAGLLDLRTGQGPYGDKAPSSLHIYAWTIGSGRTPLDVAAQFEQQETLAMMLGLASPLQQLVSACRRVDEAVVRALLREHPDLVRTMPPGLNRALADAAWHGDVDAVRLMLDVGFDPRTAGHDTGTALHCAAWAGSSEVVAVLLAHPDAAALVAARDARYRATPLGWCCHGSLHGPASHDYVGVARLLVAAGARPGPDTREASDAVMEIL